MIFLNLDLTGDGIRLSDTKVLKGTAMVTDGVVGVNLYLNTPDSGSHIKIDGNSSVDICFHDSIGTSDKIDAEFKADSNGVVRDLKIPSFGTTFKLGNVAFDEVTDTLTIGTFEITGEGSDAAEFQNLTFRQTASGFTVSIGTIAAVADTLLKADIDMGTESKKAFELTTENTDDGVKRTVSADVKNFKVEKDGQGIIETGAGSFSETSVDGVDISATAELNEIAVLIDAPDAADDPSKLVGINKIGFGLDGKSRDVKIEGFELDTEHEKVNADTVELKETFDVSAGTLTHCFKADKVTMTGKDGFPLTVTDFDADAVTTFTEEGISTDFTVSVKSITFNKDDNNKIDVGDVKLTYDETGGFAFSYDHITVKLNEYYFAPTQSDITADISMSKDSKQVTCNFYADQILISDSDESEKLDVQEFDVKFSADAEGKITENIITIGSVETDHDASFLWFTHCAKDTVTGISLNFMTDTYSIDGIESVHTLNQGLASADADTEIVKHTANIIGIGVTKADGLYTITVGKISEDVKFLGGTLLSLTWGSEEAPAFKLVMPYDMSQLKTSDLFEFTSSQLSMTVMDEYTLTAACSFKVTMDQGVLKLNGSADETVVTKEDAVISEGHLKDLEITFNTDILASGTLASVKGEFRFTAPGISMESKINSATMSTDGKGTYTLKADGFAKETILGESRNLAVTNLEVTYNIADGTVTGKADRIVFEAVDDDVSAIIEANPVLSGNVVFDPRESTIDGHLEVKGQYAATVTEDGVTTKYSVTTEDTLVFNLVEDEEDGDYILTEASWAAKVTKVTIEQSGKSAEVNINTIQLQAAYSSENGIQLYAEGEVDFDFSLPTGSDHKNLTIRGAEFEIGYTPDDGFELELRLDFLEYGTDNYAIKVAGLDGSLDLGFDIDTVTLMSNTKDNVVDVTFLDCWYVGEFLADSMAGTINGVDVARLTYSGEKLTPEDYYNGTFYFSYTEGIKAFKNGDDVEIPEDAIMVIVPTVEVTFKQTAGDKTYEIPIGDVITLDGYFDIYDHAGFFALTTDYYVVAPYSVDVVRTQTVDNLIDGQGIAKVPGSGIVFTPESLGKISVPLITIKTGGDITAKISLDGLKRLATGTQVTMLGFTKEQASEDNVGDIIRNMTPANAQKVLAGTLLIVDVGRSTVTDGLGNVEITLPFYLGDSDPAKLTAYHIYQGEVKEMNNCVYKNGYVTFTTDHFSTFLICEGLTMPADRDWFAAIITICVGLAVILIMTAAVMRDKTQKKVKAKA